MARFQYAVLSRATPGQEEEFIRWYRDQHLPDVIKFPGVIGGKIVKLDFQRVYDLNAPQYDLLTIYELEGDHPQPIIDSLKAAFGTDAMPDSASLSMAAMIQVAGHVIASSEA